jgi:hypothetical protein
VLTSKDLSWRPVHGERLERPRPCVSRWSPSAGSRAGCSPRSPFLARGVVPDRAPVHRTRLTHAVKVGGMAGAAIPCAPLQSELPRTRGPPHRHASHPCRRPLARSVNPLACKPGCAVASRSPAWSPIGGWSWSTASAPPLHMRPAYAVERKGTHRGLGRETPRHPRKRPPAAAATQYPPPRGPCLGSTPGPWYAPLGTRKSRACPRRRP